MRAFVVESGRELAALVTVADSFFMRLKGLLGSASLPHGEALWIVPCTSVHTFGMRYPIDVVVLDRNLKTLAIYNTLRPNRMTRIYPAGCSVLELPAGTAINAGLSLHDVVAIAH